MKSKIKILTGFLVISCWMNLLSEDKIELYLAPDDATEVVASIDAKDSRLGKAMEVLDEAKNEAGWKWIELSGTFTGYVQNRDIGKDLEILPGTMIRMQPSENSAVLTTVMEDDKVTLLSAGDWGKVQFAKAVPVYFKVKPLPKPVARATNDRPDAPTRPITGTYATGTAAAATTGAVATKPAIKSDDRDDTKVLGSITSDIPRYFTGKITRPARPQKTLNTLVGDQYKVQLTGLDGKRIAYLDMSSVILTSPVEEYIGKDVVVYGKYLHLVEEKSLGVKISKNVIKVISLRMQKTD